jgi:hypothetical protein
LPVLDTRQDLTLRSSVAPQLSEESLGRFATAPALHEDIEHSLVLIYRAPETMQLAANTDEHLAHEPPVARPRSTSRGLKLKQG